MQKSNMRFIVFAAAAASVLGAEALLAQQPEQPDAAPRVAPTPRYAPQAREAEKPPKAWLGVGLETHRECRNNTEDDCEYRMLISSVVVGSPAEEGGIEVGDLIVSLDGAAPGSPEFKVRLNEMVVGEPVVIEVSRGGEPLLLDVLPRTRPERSVHVRARPSQSWTWAMPEGELKVPIVIEVNDSTDAAGWTYGSDDEGYVVIAPSDDGWRVQVHTEGHEGEVEEALKHMELELRDLQRHMIEGYQEEIAKAQEQAKYWGRVKAELTPELAAMRDSVLALARVKLAEVRKARLVYRAEAREARAANESYSSAPHLAEASRRIAGAEFEPLGGELRHEGRDQGLLVLRVIPGTPAHALGLRRGDVVVEVGGSECSAVSDLREALVESDERVPVTWIRKGEAMSGALNE
jgi:C-terminal processing protease CtpA/Prc